MKNYSTNQERTEEYLDKFNREKVLKLLVGNEKPVIFDVGANDGSSIIEFKSWWPDSTVHSFEPQEECWPKLEEQAAIYSDSVIVNKIGVGAEKRNGLTFYTHNITTG